MKFLILTLIFGSCLSFIAANGGKDNKATTELSFDISTEELNDEYLQIEDEDQLVKSIEELELIAVSSNIEMRTFFSGLYWVTKSALRTLKGVHCTIKYAVDIQDAAQQFIDDINECGGVVSKQVQALIDTCNNIITTVNNIIHLNENVCNNGDYNDGTDGSKKTGWNCFWKLLKQFMNLNKQIQKALSQVKKIPTTGADASECVTNATIQLTQVFTAYPSYIKTCSKLKSN